MKMFGTWLLVGYKYIASSDYSDSNIAFFVMSLFGCAYLVIKGIALSNSIVKGVLATKFDKNIFVEK